MTPRVQREWQNRVSAEYTSAIITSRLLQLLILIGAGDDLINTCMRIVRDELDHARLSHECLIEFGGQNIPVSIELDGLPKTPLNENILPQLLDDLIYSFLLGESFAVPLFHGMYENATHPSAKTMLTRVLQDEATHRAFGWAVLDALLKFPDFNIRDYVTKKLPKCLKQFKRAYASVNISVPLSKEEKSCGLIDESAYAEIWTRTYTDDIALRFRRRGISCPDVETI